MIRESTRANCSKAVGEGETWTRPETIRPTVVNASEEDAAPSAL